MDSASTYYHFGQCQTRIVETALDVKGAGYWFRCPFPGQIKCRLCVSWPMFCFCCPGCWVFHQHTLQRNSPLAQIPGLVAALVVLLFTLQRVCPFSRRCVFCLGASCNLHFVQELCLPPSALFPLLFHLQSHLHLYFQGKGCPYFTWCWAR